MCWRSLTGNGALLRLNWLPPFAMHCTFICDDETLQAQARHYKQR
jgi:putative NADPH-quinone reductase